MRFVGKWVALSISFSLIASCASGLPEDELCAEADLVPEVCAELYDSAAVGGKADDIPRLRGIVVERVGDWTYFKIPLGYTVGGDQKRLMEETISKFSARLGELNRDMIEHGIDLSGVMDHVASEEFSSNYVNTLESVLDTSFDDDIEVTLGESYERPRELWAWQRYLVPQAFIGYFGTKFTANVGVGGGLSMTVLIVVQPWLSLAVDHTQPEPTVVDKSYQVDVAVLGAPNVDVGFGVGGGVPVRVGAGAVFGPLDNPDDLAGWGVGLSGSFSLPFAGGGQAKFIAVLKRPPLFLAMLGYNTGTSASAEIHGNLQYLMNVSQLLDWISLQLGGVPE